MPDDPPYFLRSHSKKGSTQFDCLSSTLLTEEGFVLLKDLIPQCDKKNYWIPAVWPEGKEQRGYCCGLYALDIGLKHGFGRSNIETPVARKDGNKNVVSLREVGKKEGLTAFGEIYSVHALDKLAKAFRFPNCEILKADRTNQERFTSAICKKLKKDFLVITSLDLKGSFPGLAKGLSTHWALLFGYLVIDGQCYFLATQWGAYFLFSAEKLFLSNLALPDENPKKYPDYIYYKTKKKEVYRKKDPNENLNGLDIRKPIGDTLNEFRHSLFCIPVLDAPACIDLKILGEVHYLNPT